MQSSSIFIFMDGTLPVDRTKTTSPEKWVASRNASVYPSAEGIVVEILSALEPYIVKIPNTLVWLFNETEQVDLFFNMLSE